jgi:hypothetical protein
VSPIVFSLGIVNEHWYLIASSPPSIDFETAGYKLGNFTAKFKVLVDVVFKDLDENGDNVTGTYMFTYGVDDIEWVTTPLETDIPNSSVNYNSYTESLVLNTTVFDGSPVEGCKLVGTHYTCHGWDDVTIVGDLTTSGGHTVDIFGANYVYVIGESNVSPEIVLDIKSLLDYSEPMPLADGEFVEAFCRNNLGEGFPDYQASIANKQAIEEYEISHSDNSSVEPLIELLEVDLYPVPTSDLLTIHSSIALSNEEITLVDLSGRILTLPIRKISDQVFEVNTSTLSSGAYYLNISGNEGQATKLFTVLKNN